MLSLQDVNILKNKYYTFRKNTTCMIYRIKFQQFDELATDQPILSCVLKDGISYDMS